MAPNPTAVIPPMICSTVRGPASSTSALPISAGRAEHGQNEQHTEDGAPGPLAHCGPLDAGKFDHHVTQGARPRAHTAIGPAC